MVTCVAYGCTNRSSKKTRGVTFHSFPSNPELRQAWVHAIKRKDFSPTPYSRLCSEHFTDDQKYYTSLSNVRLVSNAIPTMFNFPPYFKKILAEQEEIEKTYKQKYEFVEYLNAASLKSEDESEDNELVKSDSEESSSDIAELSDSVRQNGNLLNEEQETEDTATKSESFTVTPHIHGPMVVASQSNEPCTSFTPSIRTASLVTQYPKVVHYVSSSTVTTLPDTIRVKSTKDTAMPITKPFVEDLKRRLKEKDGKIDIYRKKIKILQQSSRRYRSRLENLKHSIFTQLKKRQYLSSDSSFKIGSQGCLLDRKTIKICESESEDSDEL